MIPRAPSALRDDSRSGSTRVLLVLGILAILAALAFLWSNTQGSGRAGLTPGALFPGDGEGAQGALPAIAGGAERGGADEPGFGARELLPSVASPGAASEGPTRTWQGRLVAREGGAGIANGNVLMVADDWESQTTTDANGSFEISWHGGLDFAVGFSAPGFAPATRPRVDIEREHIFELDRAASIRGRVIGPFGEDFEASQAYLWDLDLDRKAKRDPLEAPIDARGEFRFDDLSSGQYSVCVSVPGWSLAFEHGLSVDMGESTQLRLELVRGATLRGRVRTRASEQPIAGAELSVQPELQGVSNAVEDKGQLDGVSSGDGSFLFEGLSPGKATVRVETAWGARANATLEVKDFGEVLERDFAIPAAASLAGVVRSESGVGIGHARVRLAWQGSALTLSKDEQDEGVRSLECDVNGRFLFEELPSGRSLEIVAFRGDEDTLTPVEAELLGRRTSVRLGAGEERKDFELLVRETHSLSGRVVDESGAPIAEVDVRALRQTSEDSFRWTSTKTADDGRFELLGLLPGKFKLDLRHDDFLVAREEIDVLEGLSLPDVEYELERALRLRGWVVDRAGDAIAHARVVMRSVGLDDHPGSRSISRKSRCDEFGRFEFARLLGGIWELEAAAAGYRATPTPERIEVSEELAVELVLEEIPRPERVVVRGEVLSVDGSELGAVTLDNTRGGSLSFVGSRFRLTGVRPGKTRFTFRAAGFLSRRLQPLELLPGLDVDLGVIEFSAAGELAVFPHGPAGEKVAKFSARLIPVTKDRASRRKGSMRLGTRTIKHRFKGTEEKVSVRAAFSAEVPLRKWRLRIDAPGFKRFEQEFTLSKERPRRNLEAKLERR